MKKKNNLKEGALDVGMQSFPTAQKTSGTKKKPTITVKKQELKSILPQVKGTDVDINVVEEGAIPSTAKRMKYLSDVKDSNTGNISQPFDINGKKYQIVRALTPENEKVLGVYSLDEFDDENENIIHRIEEFEKLVDNQHMVSETGVQEPEGPEAATLNPVSEVKDEHPIFDGIKHFIVDKKNGKARKFKDISELAKAQMSDDEQYMGVKDFKKYVDETLFGARKKNMVEDLTDSSGVNDKVVASAEKLIGFIKAAPKVMVSIEKLKSANNPKANAQVISLFAELIGVPKGKLPQIISSLRDTAKSGDQQQQTQGKPAEEPAPVTENRIIKVKDIKNV